MIIRKTNLSDLDTVCSIYSDAQVFMQRSGNPDQWGNVHPPRDLIISDIEAGTSYVCECDGKIEAVFYFNIEVEPTYAEIDGKWLNDEPYGVVHRIASARSGTGAGAFCLEWCFEQCGNLRIDTHCDNKPMLGLLEKLRFSYCGIIWVENGDERKAYQKV